MGNNENLYLSYFNLKEPPFKITPTTSYFYGGGKRGETLHALLYAINSGEGIMMVSGEVGSGKTMLLRTLMDQLPEKTDIIYIANPSLSGREILYNICEELGLQSEEKRANTVRILQNYLIKRHQEGYRVVAFIDEAQAMPDDSLEEVRLLSNLETSRDKLLQIVLFGQPELEEKLSQQHLRQLRERITVALKINPFSKDDIREYISTRLHAAGHDGKQLFSNEAYRIIFAVSKGISRRINVLADKALLSAYARGVLMVEKIDAKRAVQDVSYGKLLYRSEQTRRFSYYITIFGALGCVLILALVSSIYFKEQGVEQYAPPPVTVTQDDKQVIKTDITTEIVPIIDTLTITKSDNIDNLDTIALSITAQSETIALADTAAVVQSERPQQPNADIGKRMSETIIRLNQQKDAALSGEQLALEIAQYAEEHENEPQPDGGAIEWQTVVPKSYSETAGTINNSRWDWMPASSYLRSRLNATQTWLKTNAANQQYTSRLLTVSQERAIFLEKFLRYFADYYPIRNVLVYPIELNSGKKFVVNFGIYPSRKDAEVFIENTPRYFTGGEPYAQSLSVMAEDSKGLW